MFKLLNRPAIIGTVMGLAVMSGIALLNPHKATAGPELTPNGVSYVTTVKDSTGTFASRGVISLHGDHTISVIDSGQGGPAFFFTSQLGSWKQESGGNVVARTIDFDYPPNADTARLDYSLTFTDGGSHVSGTITLITFPLQGNPLDGGGTVVGTFTVTGDLITP